MDAWRRKEVVVMICAGIDAGSRTVKAVLMESDTHAILGQGIENQGIHQGEIAQKLIEKVCAEANVSKNDIAGIIATGYGRNTVSSANKTITEISCHACGVHFEKPSARTIIDIGGQDSKVIHLDDKGNVCDFSMNDRCAAGTGRFFENVSAQLGIDISKLGDLAKSATKPCAISSMCVVFAETEIIGLLAAGETPQNITAGVERSIASRIYSMAGRKIKSPVVFTGGVALIDGMGAILEETIGHPVKIVNNPQMTGALGAAILAARNLN